MTKKNGDNHHGNNNEHKLVQSLNGLMFKQLNTNLKEFIKYISNNFNISLNDETIIQAVYEPNSNLKQDLYIIIDNKRLGISLKMGTGNSVHQEKCEDFITYIKDELDASKEVCNDFRFFIWADGTLDGSGPKDKNEKGEITCRFNASFFKKNYPAKRQNLQKFLTDHEEKLIRRFLFEGLHKSKVDVIYHGTPLNGTWITANEIIRYQLDNSRSKNPKDRSCLTVGRLTLQAWNISKKGNTEYKRGQLQSKYGCMKEDFYTLMKKSSKNIGTFLGDTQEFDISRSLNKDKNNSLWSALLTDKHKIENTYVVKVADRVKSKLSGKKVFPKSDAYLIIANISKEYLLENEYTLTEDNLKDFEYTIVSNSGISIKIKDSKKYTIQKFTQKSFCKAFNELSNADMIFAGTLLFSKETEITKNKKIFKDLKINENEFLNCFSTILNCTDLQLDKKESLDKIKKKSQEIIKNTILNNNELYTAIFTGEGWFDDPYYAKYKYINGKLEKNTMSDFSITTGSGRSKGKYSIEIKPKG